MRVTARQVTALRFLRCCRPGLGSAAGTADPLGAPRYLHHRLAPATPCARDGLAAGQRGLFWRSCHKLMMGSTRVRVRV
jgi:hypothetical protein